ncbi:LOW QUALITY PROTEIN: uncharacterized protein LOC102804035 [Saccoglossus kowalevskii]
MALLTLIFGRLGIPLAPHKTVGPTTTLEFLGIELDTIKMEARLPLVKLNRLLDLLDEFLLRRSCTKRQLLSLLGHLNFACRVVPPGRTFMSRLIELSKGIQKLHHHVGISSESKQDICMWKEFLSGWNGISLFLDRYLTPAPDMQLFTDASGIGHGGYFRGYWFHERWATNLRLDHDKTLSSTISASHTLPDSLSRDVRLNQAVDTCQRASLGIRTVGSYATGVRTWCVLQFAAMFKITGQSTTYPVISENILVYFVTHCATYLHLKFSTIKVYLAGIRNHYLLGSHSNPLVTSQGLNLLRLQYVLRGIRRLQGSATRPRLPITFDLLKRLCLLLRSGVYGPYFDLLLEAAFLLAFFGFLQCSEFTSLSQSFNPQVGLCVKDIKTLGNSRSVDALVVTIKSSKTDQFRRGFELRLYPTGSAFCPVSSLHRFLLVRHKMGAAPHKPLFMLPERVPLDRAHFTNSLRFLLTRLGFKAHLFAGHSFRIGAATTAASVHLPDHLIQTMGRWSSNCYRTYIRTPEQLLQSAFKTLASV